MRGIIIFLLLLPVCYGVIITPDAGITWEFYHIENDTELNTEIKMLNETYLEFNVTEKYDLPHNYRWKMALCNITGVDELFYMEEDAQGGFNYSYPIGVVYGYLPNYGLPNEWCINTSGWGYILYSSGSVNQLPLRIRLILPENYPIQFYLYTGSSTSIIDSAGQGRSTAPTASENLFRSSDGILHIAYLQNGADLWYGNSSDNGDSWNGKKELKGGFLNYDNIGILGDSKNYLYIYFEGLSVSPQVVRIINSTNYGTTWSAETDLFLSGYSAPPGGQARAGPTAPSCIMDKDDIIHCCAIENNTGLSYVNTSTFGNDTFIHQEQADRSNWCDIAVDSNNTICIVALGTVEQDIDVFCSQDGWQRHHVDDTSSFLYIHGEYNAPTITVDNDDMFHIAYDDPTGFGGTPYLRHANFTAGNLSDNSTAFSKETVSPFTSYYFDIGVSSQNDLWILYSNNTDLRNIQNGYLLSANRSYKSTTWTINEVISTGGNAPSILDSHYPCSNRMTDFIRYAWINATPPLGFTPYVMYQNKSIYYPSCFPDCNKDWVVNCEDICENYRERDIRPYNFRVTGAGDFITYADIWASDFYFNVTNCNAYVYNSFLRLE